MALGGVAGCVLLLLLHYARQMPSDKDDKDVSMLLIALLANDDGVDIRKDNMMSSRTDEGNRGGTEGAERGTEGVGGGELQRGAQSYLITMPCIMGLSLTSCLPACVCVIWAFCGRGHAHVGCLQAATASTAATSTATAACT